VTTALTEIDAIHVLVELLVDELGGRLVAEENGRPVDVIVCCACDDDHPLLRIDFEIVVCADCGRRLQFDPRLPRPGAPDGGRMLCVWCALTHAKQGVHDE
jgi:hypothetical protein